MNTDEIILRAAKRLGTKIRVLNVELPSVLKIG